MTTQIIPSNPSSIKTRFAYRFLRSLKRLNKNRRASPSSEETYRRSHMIRVASYASMASAVGPKRAWSRAILFKIRNRTWMKQGRIHHSLRRRGIRDNHQRNNVNFHQEDGLRKLIPGAEGMDFCRLLNETAHFIKCLRTQVQIMKSIADHCSN